MKLFNKLYGISLFSLLLSVAACTSETEEQHQTPAPDPSGGEARREVLLTLKNKLSVAQTKAGDAIATAAENKISALDIYVFGSATEDGVYTYQERFCYRENSNDLPHGGIITTFDLTAKDMDAKETTALLSLKKGLFVKLYCIANQTKLMAADGSLVKTFQALQQSNPGQKDNTIIPGIPEEKDFLMYHSPLIDPASVTNILVTPLLMTGSYTTPLDLTDFSVSARLQLGFRLTRAVARFDIVNDAATSNFTIQSVSMAKGRKGVNYFPLKVTGVLPEAADDDLITYPARKFEGENANAGTTVGAFYIYPSPEKDGGCLILSGTYAANKTDNIPVTYKVPFKPADGGNYIEISQNHRYTVNITAADEYHLDFTLDVADWTDEGTIDEYEPGGDVDKDGLIVNITAESGTYDENTRMVTMSIANNAQFTIEGGSTSGYYTRMYYENEDMEHQWLMMTPPADVTKAGAAPTAYTIKKNDAYMGTKFPVAFIRFTDQISAKETVVIVQPVSKPIVTGTSSSEGCSYIDNIMILYQPKETTPPSAILKVFASGGSELSLDENGNVWEDWLTITPGTKQDLSQSEYTLTLNASSANIPSPYPSTGKTIYVINQGDKTKKELITAKISSLPVIKTKEIIGGSSLSSYDEGSKTMHLFNDGSTVKLTIFSIGGCVVNDVDKPSWVTVTPGADNNTMDLTFSQQTLNQNATGTIKIRNKNDETKSIELKVNNRNKNVTIESTQITLSGTNSSDTYLVTGLSQVTPKVMFYPAVSNYFAFKVRSPKAVSTNITDNKNQTGNGSISTWLSASSTYYSTESNGDYIYTIQVSRYTSTSTTVQNIDKKYAKINISNGVGTTKIVEVVTEAPTYPGSPSVASKLPAIENTWTGVRWWIGPTVETNVSPTTFNSRRSAGTLCPDGWWVPSHNEISRAYGGTTSDVTRWDQVSYSGISSSTVQNIYGPWAGYYLNEYQETSTAAEKYRMMFISNGWGSSYDFVSGGVQTATGNIRCVKDRN